MENLVPHFIELIRRASTDLPADIEAALHKARDAEEPGSAAQTAFDSILENVRAVTRRLNPHLPGHRHPDFLRLLPDRLVDPGAQEADPRGGGRRRRRSRTSGPNSVDTLTGKNPGNNLGDDFPYFHFEEWEEPYLQVDLMLKGGGCENVGAQYSMPTAGSRPAATWRACAGRCSTRCTRRRAWAARPRSSAWRSAATAGPATSSRRSSSTGRWTTSTRTRSWRSWRSG